MKKIKIQFLLMIVLLCQGLPMSGMMSQAARQAGRSGRLVGVPAKSQTGWQRFLSWVSGSPRRTPFTSGTQRRTFSETRPQQAPRQSSFWDEMVSYFKPTTKELTLQEIDDLLWGHREKIGGYWAFGDEDLKIAMEKIGGMIESNNKYRDAIIEEIEHYYPFETRPKFTLLDKVLYHLFGRDQNRLNHPDEPISDNTINYIKLAKYLIDKGAHINPQNYNMYKRAYLELLMPSYKRLYEPYPQASWYPTEYEIQKFKEIFKELDPVLEKLIPGFKNELETAQKEREEIELNPKAYKEKLADEQYRSEYKFAKAQRMSDDYNKRTGKSSSANDFLDRVIFNEKEYQSWLKSGRDPRFFSGSSFRFNFTGSGQQRFQQDELTQSSRAIWNLLPGLTETSSKEEIAKAFRAFQLKNHPDRLPKDISDKDREEIDKKVKEVNVAWDAYNEQLKQQRQRTTE